MVAALRTAMGAALFARTIATGLSMFATLSRIRLLPPLPRELTVLRACAREDCSEGSLDDCLGLRSECMVGTWRITVGAKWCAVGASGVLRCAQRPLTRCSHSACAGLKLVFGWAQGWVNVSMCWCAVVVGCAGACGASRGAEWVRILQFLCLRTPEHASRGNAGSFGQVWCAGATRPGLGHMCRVLQGRAFGLRARS